MITSPNNEQLKTIRKLQDRRWRERLGLFVAEGEDLVDAAAAAGWEPELLLRAGEDVERDLLDGVSSLGSGSRVIGVYPQRWSEPAGRLMVYLHAVDDPGNVGTILRAAHGLCDGPVLLGPGCADPYSPKAVRASMGSLFARPPGRCGPADLKGTLLALDAHAERALAEVTPEGTPLVVCLGAEREGLPTDLLERASHTARIPLRRGGPDSLNVAMAATVALYDLANRMAGHA
ncbi:MAG TPA: RNA methyltransferase [Thermoleophilaceae bacterium]|nr:RNA methyltransferase [Thermoleophilaceae bacterium]